MILNLDDSGVEGAVGWWWLEGWILFNVYHFGI